MIKLQYAVLMLLVTCHTGVLAAPRSSELDAASLRRAIEDLNRSYPVGYRGADYLKQLEQWEKVLPRIRAGVVKGNAQALTEVKRFKAFKRAALLANPLLDFDRLLIIKRKPLGDPRLAKNHRGLGEFNGVPQQSSFQLYRIPNLIKYENEICVLSGLREDPKMHTLFKPAHTGLLSDLDLHWDADRMVFAMVNPKGRLHLFELSADGTGLRQLSPNCEADDIDYLEPCYLPNDNLLFLSSAAFQGVPCNASIKVSMSYVMDRATRTIRQLTFEQDHNYTPTIMNDGRILYLRWEYTDIPHVWGRYLFTMNPDGTGQRALYGSGEYWPNSTFFARSIPGDPRKLVGIVTGHHEGRDGQMVIIDPGQGRKGTDGIAQQIPRSEKKLEPVILDKLTEDCFPRMLFPWPLSDKYFIVTSKPKPNSLWGIYLVDIYENMTLLKEEEGFALYEPIPLQPRKRPRVILDRVDLARKDALVSIENIYFGPGLAGVPRGSVKALRVFTYHFAFQDTAGIRDRIGADGPWEPKRVLGTVPVEEDGSAFFRIPANTPISIQPVDADGQALQLMRSWMTAMPGEIMSCVGCHEDQNAPPPPRRRRSIAMRRAPSELEPWKGPERGFSFKRDVQPVLDKYCVSCHDGSKPQRGPSKPDLRGDQDFIYAYNGKSKPALVKINPETEEDIFKNYSGVFQPSYIELRARIRVGGLESDIRLLNPGEFEANTSELIQMLKKGHHGVELDRDAWNRIYTWIDLNGPCHGTWGEAIGEKKIKHYPQRRLELAKRYAQIAMAGEQVPELPEQVIEPVIPEKKKRKRVKIANPVGWPFGMEEAARQQGGKVKTVDLGNGVTMELQLVPAGTFVMGSPSGHPDETPRVAEVKKPFWMGSLEVTNQQYQRFNPAHESRFEHKGSWVFSEKHLGWPLDKPNQPVVRVAQQEALAFCRWLSEKTGQAFTLPSEVQWEWACRAGSDKAFFYGNLNSDFYTFANMSDAMMKKLAYDTDGRHTVDMVPRDERFDDGYLVTAPVGSYKPNAWGLRDMHGNVWEWTCSTYGNIAETVARGGSWRDRPKRCTASYRISYPNWQKIYNVGFRVVMEADDGPRLAWK
jgi:formylglycine-generating enzyme required for sulfatase activity